MNIVLLITVIFAWGLSWYAIAIQVGTIPVEASIAYRFLVAGGLLLAWCAYRKGTASVPARLHPLLALMGVCLFSLNFVLLYSSTAFVVSGVTSVVFAGAALMGAVNVWLFDGVRPGGRIVVGAIIGIGGLGLLSAAEGAAATNQAATHVGIDALGGTGFGLLLALGGTYLFSLGNIVSTRVRGRADFVTATAWAMLYGGALAAVASFARHGALPLPPVTFPYLTSLFYLVFGASLIGFLAYLDLVRRAGASRAAYATVLFPLVALTLSSLFEGYTWTWSSGLGVVAILLGALLVFTKLPSERREALREREGTAEKAVGHAPQLLRSDPHTQSAGS